MYQITASPLSSASALLKSAKTGRSGVLLILDELGKLLEHAVADANDIHLLQDLAERSARSEGRLVVIGILHQAFDQYAARASRDAREKSPLEREVEGGIGRGDNPDGHSGKKHNREPEGEAALRADSKGDEEFV